MGIEALIIQLGIALVTHAPDLISKIQSIHKSTTMTEEEKQEAYAKLREEFASTVEKVKAAQL